MWKTGKGTNCLLGKQQFSHRFDLQHFAQNEAIRMKWRVFALLMTNVLGVRGQRWEKSWFGFLMEFKHLLDQAIVAGKKVYKKRKIMLAVRKTFSLYLKTHPIFLPPFFFVLKENSTCAPASCSVLSVSGMLWAAVVRRCHGNGPLYFFRGARGFWVACIMRGMQLPENFGVWGVKRGEREARPVGVQVGRVQTAAAVRFSSTQLESGLLCRKQWQVLKRERRKRSGIFFSRWFSTDSIEVMLQILHQNTIEPETSDWINLLILL